MTKKYYKEERHEEISKHKVGQNLFCDVCKKIIGTGRLDNGYLKPTDYLTVNCGHHDWGNDSCDSFEYMDFCSIECMMEHQKEFWKENKGSKTAFYEIEKDIWSKDIYVPDGTEEVKREYK